SAITGCRAPRHPLPPPWPVWTTAWGFLLRVANCAPTGGMGSPYCARPISPGSDGRQDELAAAPVQDCHGDPGYAHEPALFIDDLDVPYLRRTAHVYWSG